jgi:acetyl esterase
MAETFPRAEALALLTGLIARAVVSLPRPLLGLLFGEPPPPARGLDPEAWALARLSAMVNRPAGDVPLELGRRVFEVRSRPLSVRPAPAVATEDRVLPGQAGDLRARLYVPSNVPDPSPLLLYFHGGGWVRGSIATHDASCRMLAQLAGVRLLSVDYRMAPEHPFPAAADDAQAAYAHVASNPGEYGADPARLALGGDSAGGNLAAVTALALRGGDLPQPAFQLLVYPACDLVGKRPSVATFSTGYFLTEANMDWYKDQYVPDRDRRGDPRVSPLLADDVAGLPPAYVATALADPLRDEGDEYAERLLAAGVPVAHQVHPLIHGFLNMTAGRSSREAIAQIAGALRQGLAFR